jgi:hypothetical protein
VENHKTSLILSGKKFRSNLYSRKYLQQAREIFLVRKILHFQTFSNFQPAKSEEEVSEEKYIP